jgi:hypothetical protein
MEKSKMPTHLALAPEPAAPVTPLSTTEILVACGITRNQFVAIRKENPAIKPLKTVGIYLIWAPETLELVKRLASQRFRRA